MSTIEQLVTQNPAATAKARSRPSLFSGFLKTLSSVRLGVGLLILLGVACLAGMLIMQQNVSGFDRYFAQLTPAQRLVYTSFGLFDIYHSWLFNFLLALLSLNIVLASIDRWPKTWKLYAKANVAVPLRWMREQKQTAICVSDKSIDEVTDLVVRELKTTGWRSVSSIEKHGKRFVFGQSGVWNRFGAYPVHVGLLTIFIGGFLTATTGSTGNLPLAPGQTTNLMFENVVDIDRSSEVTKKLPFQVTCTDIQQKLIKKDKSLSAMNTIDWITRFNITDETGTHEASVQMNRPYDYRGYRFFQASFIPIGRARNISITARPADGRPAEQLTIPRDGSAVLTDGTTVRFSEFRGDFTVGKEDPDEDTSDYQNPAALLQVSNQGGIVQQAYAFGPQMANAPIASKPVGGYTFKLDDFERVGEQHILSVQRDPGATVVYVGFIILFLALVSVFFFSHQRVWAAIESDESGAVKLLFAGNTNRNNTAFDQKFTRFIAGMKFCRKEDSAVGTTAI